MVSTVNSGLSAARNYGVSMAKGEYLGFVDSDDWVEQNYFEKLYCAALKTGSDIAVGEILRLNNFKRRYFIKYKEEVVADNFDKKLRVCDVPEKNYVWNKIYKRESFLRAGLKFLPVYYEDVIFTPEALRKLGRLVTVPDTCYCYWRTPNSIVTRKSKKYIEARLNADKTAQEFFQKEGLDYDKYKTYVKKYKIFGLTFFKYREKEGKKQYVLFSILKFGSLN